MEAKESMQEQQEEERQQQPEQEENNVDRRIRNAFFRPHQYERTTISSFVENKPQEQRLWCRMCAVYLMDQIELYHCTACKRNKYAMCIECYQKAVTDNTLDDLGGCEGDDNVELEEEEEEALFEVLGLQLEDTDLIVTSRPKYYVPPVEGTQSIEKTTTTGDFVRLLTQQLLSS